MLLAVVGLTILRIDQLLSVHLFVGMLLIPPALLKLSSIGYRFVRYYTGNPRYREKGAPGWPLRVIAPMVVLSTLVVCVSGVVLLFVGPSARATWFPIHKDSFFVWAAFMAIHVIRHLLSMPRVLRAEYSRLAITGWRENVALRGAALGGASAFSLFRAVKLILSGLETFAAGSPTTPDTAPAMAARTHRRCRCPIEQSARMPRAGHANEPSRASEPDRLRGSRHVRRAATRADHARRAGLPDHRRRAATGLAGRARDSSRPCPTFALLVERDRAPAPARARRGERRG